MRKKITAFLCAVLMLATVAVPAFAAEITAPEREENESKSEKVQTKDVVEGIYGGMEYEIAEGEVTITGYVIVPEGELIIPEAIEGYPVTTIGAEAFDDCEFLTRVEMPNVQTIGGQAFDNCNSLASVEMSNVQTIGAYAFRNCYSLTSVEMPSAQAIGNSAFYGCYSLTSVEMPSVQTIGNSAFYGCHSLASVEMPKVQAIGNRAFSGCETLTSFIVGSDNENYSAEGGILYNKDKSTLIAYPSAADGIKIADSVQTIGEYAFYNCSSLTSMEMPSVQTIGEYAFYNCSSLTSTEMPSVQTIGEYAFYNCSSLTSMEMPNVQTIGDDAFRSCRFLKRVEMPSVQTIGDSAFYGCNSLTSVEMSSVQTIGAWAFDVCYSLVSVEMPNVQTIDSQAFDNCYSLKRVEMPNVQTIGSWAFNNCCSLKRVEMPSVQTIANNAFYYCYSLTSVEMPKVQAIGLRAFSGCKTLISFIVGSDNENYSSEGGILYNKDKSTLIAYPSAADDIKIADSVQTIGRSAFYVCESLTHVEMPNVQAIGDYAFHDCDSLESAEMPNVQTIGDEAFRYCKSLTHVKMPNVKEVTGNSLLDTKWYDELTDEFCIFGDGVLVKYCGTATDVTVPDNVKCVAGFYLNDNIISVTMPNVQTISERAFNQCDSLESVEMPNVQTIDDFAFDDCNSLTSVEMLNVQTVDDYAFYGCDSLTSLEMPNVQTIDDFAFDDCNSLTSVEMPNVQTIGRDAFYFCESLTSVEMPNVQTIDDLAFYGCDSLTRVEMPNVQTIGDYAFYGCDSLASAYFYSDAPTSFGEHVFADCADDFTIYYESGTQGWTTPTWNGYPTQEFTPTHTVTFADGITGETVSTATVQHGEDATLPEPPVHEGYTFTGWDSDGTNITADTTITAQYTVNVYTLSYYVDGELYEEVEYAYGAAITPIAEPAREGYTFSGWSAIPETMPANDVRIDGTFAINTYTVTFVDGITGETISTATVQHGSDVTFPEATVHEGYTFTGWDSDGKNITADTTITAQYEAVSVGVHGDLSGDGMVNTADAVSLLKLAAGMIELTPEQESVADVNRDGKVNTADAVTILKYAAGLIDEL